MARRELFPPVADYTGRDLTGLSGIELWRFGVAIAMLALDESSIGDLDAATTARLEFLRVTQESERRARAATPPAHQ